MPASVLLNYKDGVYAIDSAYNESDDPDKNVLVWLVSLSFFLNGVYLNQISGHATGKVLDYASRRVPATAS